MHAYFLLIDDVVVLYTSLSHIKCTNRILSWAVHKKNLILTQNQAQVQFCPVTTYITASQFGVG